MAIVLDIDRVRVSLRYRANGLSFIMLGRNETSTIDTGQGGGGGGGGGVIVNEDGVTEIVDEDGTTEIISE